MPCDICTGLGDSWHYGPLPEAVESGLLLIEYGVPNNGPLDRDRFMFASCMRFRLTEGGGPRLVWAPTSGWGNDGLVENDDHHTVRWQWLRGEPNAQPISADARTELLHSRCLPQPCPTGT